MNEPFSVEVLVIEYVKKCRLNFVKSLCCFLKTIMNFVFLVLKEIYTNEEILKMK